MRKEDFWYIAAESHELGKNQVISRSILNEWVALFRTNSGQVVALQDKCLHRTAQLSNGKVINNQLQCSYHGWSYDQSGAVVRIPSLGPDHKPTGKCAKSYQVIEKENYIYVKLSQEQSHLEPFSMPCHRETGYTTIRLQNLFQNNVTNCAENFVDIPHTTFVHPKIFRDSKNEKFGATIERNEGRVKVTYKNEKKNFGWFSWFLNSSGKEIGHTDEFFVPNITSVHYRFGGKNHFIITSQSIPVNEKETLVYTDLTYNYGIWTKISRPFVRLQAQAIINQDIRILNNQMKTILKYGAHFQNSPADIIHTWIESLQSEIEEGRDPYMMPKKEVEIEFWV
jgi:phenylpropionate dioxygenase-like ring-hydroxylating dioxygenase large terminal subunit